MENIVLVTVMMAFLHGSVTEVVASPQKGETPSRLGVERLEKELSKEKEKFELFKMKEGDILARLSEIEKEVAEKKVRIASLSGGVLASMKKVRALQGHMEILEKSLKAVEDLLMERLVILYKYSRRAAMRILATASDLDQFQLRVKYLGVIMREDQKVLEKLAQSRQSQAKEISDLRRELSQAEDRRRQEEDKLSALKKDLETRVSLLIKTHKEKEFYEIAVKELAAGAQDLKDTLLDVEKKPAKYGGKMEASRFAENKGNLPSPIGGKIIRGSAVLGPAAASLRRGVYIEGKGEEEVRCIFPGRVDFSGSVKGYGEMIIINHGSRFFTIAAELDQRTKKRGDQVQAGEVIGLVGSQEKSGPARLYFEIRHGTKILDPTKWLKGG
jgi:murein hydrolase activator